MPLEEMIDRLAALKANVYMVCDGAIVPSISREFQREGISAFPLFKDRLDPRVVEAGPWLAYGGNSRPWLAKAVSFAASRQVGVFWVASVGTGHISRHLRSLNIACLPNSSVAYFRHYDPDGLAWLCDKLSADQAARLFGPALMIGFGSGFAAGATISRPNDLPEAKSGLLYFSDEQMEAFKIRNESNSHDRIRVFVRSCFKDDLAAVDDKDLASFVRSGTADGRQMGLTREDHLAIWVHMAIESRAQSLGNKQLAGAVLAS